MSYVIIGGIYYSINGGSSWTKSNAPDNIFWLGITSNANGQYLAVGTQGMLLVLITRVFA